MSRPDRPTSGWMSTASWDVPAESRSHGWEDSPRRGRYAGWPAQLSHPGPDGPSVTHETAYYSEARPWH